MDEFDLDLDSPKENPKQTAHKKELSRRSQDRIRVYNPTDADHVTFWARAQDGGGFRVPAKDKDAGFGKGQAILPRYVAAKYVVEMGEKLQGLEVVEATKAENERRIKTGAAIMTPWQEQEVFESRFKVNQKKDLPALIKTLWLGVEQEYAAEEGLVDEAAFKDQRTDYEKVLDDLNRPAQPRVDAPQMPQEALEPVKDTSTKSSKDKLVEELS